MMKKFLSSLLALTMILSLVIVPANAAAGDTIDGVSVSSSNVTLTKLGDTTDVTFTVPKNLTVADTVTVNSKEVIYNGKLSHSIASSNNNVAMCSQNGNTVTITAVGYGETIISYTVSLAYLDNGTAGTATQTLTTKVTVKPPVTYTYEIGGSVGVTANPNKDLKSGDTVTFTANTDSVTVTKKGSDNTEVAVSKDEYTLSYDWTRATATADKSKATATLTTEKPNDKLDVTCKVTAAFKSGSDKITGSVTSKPCTVNFTNPSVAAADKAQADF